MKAERKGPGRRSTVEVPGTAREAGGGVASENETPTESETWRPAAREGSSGRPSADPGEAGLWAAQASPSASACLLAHAELGRGLVRWPGAWDPVDSQPGPQKPNIQATKCTWWVPDLCPAGPGCHFTPSHPAVTAERQSLQGDSGVPSQQVAVPARGTHGGRGAGCPLQPCPCDALGHLQASCWCHMTPPCITLFPGTPQGAAVSGALEPRSPLG